MKKIVLLATLALALTLTAACSRSSGGNGGAEQTGTGGESSHVQRTEDGGLILQVGDEEPIIYTPPDDERMTRFEEEKRYEFTLMRCGLLGPETDNAVIRTFNEFASEYNINATFIGSGYDTWRQILYATIAVGDPIDVVYTDSGDYPLFAAQGYSQPISPYVDVSSGAYNLAIMDNMFSYQGERYVAVSRNDGSPYLLFYNKDMLENEGIEDPSELVARGEWTWAIFEEICIDLTRDTDGDGVDDRWGYTGWYPWSWLGTNHTSLLSFDGFGAFSLNIDNPAVFETLSYLQSMYGITGRRWYNTVGNDIFASFYSGVNGFINEYSWAWDTIQRAKDRGEFAFDVGVVRMPYGPSNDAGVNMIHAGGFSVMNGSNNPYTAGIFLDILMTNLNDPSYSTSIQPPPEMREMIDELLENPYSHALADSPVDLGRELIDAVALTGTDISQAIERVRNPWQARVDAVNRPVEMPERRPFDDIYWTFDTDTEGIIKYEHRDQAGLNYGVEHVANGIDGGSVLLSTSFEDNGTWCDIAVIDISTGRDIVGWQRYRVSFDYRVDSVPGEASRYEFNLINDEGQSSAPSRLDIGEQGDSGHYEFIIEAMPTNSRTITLQFTAYMADSIMIDNFRMEGIE